MTQPAASLTNEAFHEARSQFHLAGVRKKLSGLGFDNHDKIKLQPENENAVPLVFVTGVNAEQFDTEKHTMTDTKAIAKAGNGVYMLNQSAAFVAVMLEDTKHEIVMQVKPDAVARVKAIFSELPGYERLQIIPLATDDNKLTSKFYEAASGVSNKKPIARVDLALYESFAAGIDQPFKPIYDENVETVINAVAKRATFYHRMSLIAYDLMANTDQDSLRVLSLTALAAQRVGGNLLADAAHKQISTNYVQTLAQEINFHIPHKKTHCIEVAPGIVDNGIYDNPHAREATVERAMINGFAFASSGKAADSVADLPKLNPLDIGRVALQYLQHAAGEDFHDRLPERVRELAKAGRSDEDIASAGTRMIVQKENHAEITHALPAWAYTSGTAIGRFAPLQEKGGYQFVPVCPAGQMF